MNPKQKLILMIGGAVCGIVVLVLAVFLFRAVGEMSTTAQERDDAKDSLESAYNAKPYPSAENEKIRRGDVSLYNAWADKAHEMLTATLEGPDGETASQFVDRVSNRVRELKDRQVPERAVAKSRSAQSATVEDSCDFSFGRYVDQGEMPNSENVERLARQFAVIDYISTLLFDNGALQIKSVTREAFDSAAAAPVVETRTTRRTSRRATATAKPVAAAGGTTVDPILAKEGVTCESFTIQFRARYSTVAKVLNAMAKDKLFFVVTDLSMSNTDNVRTKVEEIIRKREAKVLKGARGGRNRTNEPAAEVKREDMFKDATVLERLVSDPETVSPQDVTLKFDLYTAKPLESDKEGK